jgi:tetratricopeptide (TPR) repeat protein
MQTFRRSAEGVDKGVSALAEGGKDKTALAVKCFEKAVSIYPKFVDARFRLGTAYMDLAQWDKAEQRCSRRLK